MTSIIDMIFDIIGELFRLIGELFGMIRNSTSYAPSDTYNATFTQAKKILSRKGDGLSIGGKFFLDGKVNMQHLAVIAGSGYGKSTCIAVPTLFNVCNRGNVIVLDPSKELLNTVGKKYESEGYEIITINFSDRTGEESHGWNPFPESEDDLAVFISSMVSIELGSSQGEKYWSNAAENLLILLGKPIYKLPEKYQNMSTLIDLLNMITAKPKELELFMSLHADEQTWNEYLSFCANSDNLKASILSTAKSVVGVFTQKGIKRITSHRTFDLRGIREGKKIIFLQTNASELITYKLLVSLFFDSFIRQVLSDSVDKEATPLYMMLDEAGIYRIPSLSLGITQGRKFNLSIACLMQDKNQFVSLYGVEQSATIFSNCYSTVFFTNQSLQTARELEQIAGIREFENENGVKIKRPLITSDEIRSLPPNKAIFLHGHHRMSIVDLVPYYNHSRFNRWASNEPFQQERKLPIEIQAVFPIEQFISEKGEPTYEN